MNQPKWEDYMLPELISLKDKKEHSRREIRELAANLMNLSSELKETTISSGMPIYQNRADWALTYLKESGLILPTSTRAMYIISPDGLEVVNSNKKTFTKKDLERYPGYQEFVKRTKSKSDSNEEYTDDKVAEEMSPEERLDQAEREIKEKVCSELLAKVRTMSPKAFENLVVKLLLAMGYGDINDKNCGFVIGKSGDNGIDGIIKQDKLGLDLIYVQAKRYAEGNLVSPHDVRDFCGSLMTKNGGAKKGVFITSSTFTKEGKDHVKDLDKNYKIILINGNELVDYMYQNGIGVTNDRTIAINKIDADFFDED